MILSLFALALIAPSTVALADDVCAIPKPTPSEAFACLAQDYWDARMRLSPTLATFYKYPKYHDLLDEHGAKGREAEKSVLEGLFKRLRGIDRTPLADSEQVSWDVMELLLRDSLEWHRHKLWQWDVDHMDGAHSWFATVIELAQPMRSEEDAQALLKRLDAFPRYFEDQKANLREGLKEGRVAARIPVERTIRQLREMRSMAPDATPIARAAKRLPGPLKAKYLPLILRSQEESVFRAYLDYEEFLDEDYLPRARSEKTPGISFLPDGPAAYRYLIRRHTTLDLEPRELHRIGSQELASIHAEMEVVARRMNHSGDLKSFMEKVRKDPANFFETREEVLKDAERLVDKATARLPDFIGTLPKTPLVVKPVEDYKEKNEVAARYYPPPDDLSRPGIYYINTYEPASRPRFSMASLAVHEGVPGHHLQIALAVEKRDLPAFRRHLGFTAFVEGWALYSERLGDEMGLYAEDLTRVGMLSDQALRACRLVVDTGLHALGWERRKAIDFMKANTPMSEEEIVAEVDRYIIWPGQALAYKVGQREISSLRRESQSLLGKDFDLRRFHDAVLENGAVPLTVLRQVIVGRL